MLGKKLIFSQQEIANKVRELGQVITKDYRGKKPVLVGILNGAFIFMADLVRAIDLPIELDFIRVASYGSNTVSSGTISLTKDVELPVEDKDILLVEDIIDTGRTLQSLIKHFEKKKPASLKICTLIDKKERREVDIEADYFCFKVREGFLVGYGLDYAQHHRHYSAIYHLISPVK